MALKIRWHAEEIRNDYRSFTKDGEISDRNLKVNKRFAFNLNWTTETTNIIKYDADINTFLLPL